MMKKWWIGLCLTLLLFSNAGWAQGGKTYDNLILPSVLMKKRMSYALYLPPGYHFSKKTYPVLYLLHGAGENHTAWLRSGNLKEIADRLIESGAIDPLIIVMPDAGMSYYMNSSSGEVRYEDYFFREFKPYIESLYRVEKGKRFTSVAGFSMGGYGALLYALHHPEQFRTCVALSPGVRTDEEMEALSEKDYNARYRIALGPHAEGVPHVSPYYAENYSILNLITRMPQEQKKEVRFYIDCGDDDFLYKGNSMLHILLRDHGIPHEFRIRDGGHNWAYWQAGLRDGLLYIQSGLRR